MNHEYFVHACGSIRARCHSFSRLSTLMHFNAFSQPACKRVSGANFIPQRNVAEAITPINSSGLIYSTHVDIEVI